MKRDYLEGLGLEKDVIDKVMAEHGNSVNDLRINLTAAETEVSELKGQLTERDADIVTLKKTSGTTEELQTQIETLETKYKTDTEELTAKLAKEILEHKVELALTTNKAKNVTAVKALLDTEKLEVVDGQLKGLEEQLTTIREENDFLFETVENSEDPTKKKDIEIVNPANPNPGQQTEEDKMKEALGLK